MAPATRRRSRREHEDAQRPPEGVNGPRIVHVLHALNGRAIAEVVGVLAGEMAASGFQVALVAVVHTPEASPVSPAVEVIALSGRGRQTVTSVHKLWATLRALRPSVVYAHGNGPIRATVLATRFLRDRPRVVGIEHNHYSSYPWRLRALRDVLNRLLLPRTDLMLGVSPGVAEDLAETFPALRGQLAVAPAPLLRYEEFDSLAKEPASHPWLDDQIPVIVTVGHVHARKDHQTLVRAMARVREVAGPNAARLLIIGSDHGDEAAVVRQLIDDLRLGADIDLVGQHNNPLPFVARSDIFALSSRNEGMGIAIVEAMRLGVPVVSTDCPSGPAWLLCDGQHGLLVSVGDHEAFGDALVQLLSSEQQRQRLGQAGPIRAKDFEPAAIAHRYLQLGGLVP